jgi:hypothetical protein
VLNLDVKSYHLATQRSYPQADKIPLPGNVDPNEATRFSPLRNRDINSSAMSVHDKVFDIDVTLEETKYEQQQSEVALDDKHLQSYDKNAPVNLCSVMQTLVPEPFVPPTDDLLRSSHLSFPGGNWCKLNSLHFKVT